MVVGPPQILCSGVLAESWATLSRTTGVRRLAEGSGVDWMCGIGPLQTRGLDHRSSLLASHIGNITLLGCLLSCLLTLLN
jgi:hypothetical protein